MARRPKPWYRKSHKRWYVTLGGVQRNLGPNKKAAYERFYELMHQYEEESTPESVSLDLVCEKFLEWLDANRSAETLQWYRCRLQSFLDNHPVSLVADLKPLHITQWLGRFPNHSSTTRRNNIRAVKRCVQWAFEEGYIAENPIAHVKAPTAESREIEVTLEEFQDLLDYVPSPGFRNLLMVTWETGCRPQESLRVEARHVDLENSRWVFPKKEAKVKSMPRIVYLTDEAMRITRELMIKHPTGPLFLNSRGVPWNKNSVGCVFHRIQIRMGRAVLDEKEFLVKSYRINRQIPKLKASRTIGGMEIKKTDKQLLGEARSKLTDQLACRIAPRYSLYALRHSWATRALANGVDALTVAILLGHKDPSTLARTYQHLSHNPKHLLNQAKRAAG